MSLFFDILHLAVAALLAIIGVGYEREEECPPVRFQPAAEVQMVEADGEAASTDAALLAIADCEASRGTVRLPAL